ncbi:acyltransferase family protein [Butyrivibrio sp. XPD2002]|uniref:acyltransferase family protein n=1 Tax=Butyrivibrio sp. XPD2002 TaxID=1280665 RepID=UPI0004226EED|nr:acyltransferase family protein [Butyrivibrio sp. XPD2002]
MMLGRLVYTRKKNPFIEFWRFVFMMIIVIFHFCGNCRGIREENSFFWFRTGFIYVEFFFMLTGFFTAKHFSKRSLDANYGLKYVANKYREFFPVYFIVVSLAVVIQNLGVGLKNLKYGDEFFRFIMNLFMLSAVYSPEGTANTIACPAQVWYLSAMFMCLPIVVILLNSRVKDVFSKCLSLLIFLLYYGRAGFVERDIWPSDLARGFASLCMGIFLYEMANGLEKKIDKSNEYFMRMMLIVIGSLSMALTVYYTYNGVWERLPLNVMLFSGGILFLFVGGNYTKSAIAVLMNFLGDLSRYIFLIHFPVIMAINHTTLISQLGKIVGAVIYVFITLFLAFMCYAFDLALRRKNRQIM